MKIVFYGLTVTSSWGNGHATTYRSLLKALAQRGHTVHFVEKDVEWYRNNRDLAVPKFCTVQLYEFWDTAKSALIQSSSDADVIVIGSYFPDAIEATQALLQTVDCPLLFYDIDTPITMARLRANGVTEYLDAALIPHYSAYLSFTGGPALKELEFDFKAKRAIAFYCSVDPDLYHPFSQRQEYRSDLSYLGTYAADRQAKLIALLDSAAGLMPKSKFIVAGPQYSQDIAWQKNVLRIDHIAPPDHPGFYSSSRFTLNLTRSDMVAAGYSPSVRLFEASACAATILSDEWPGLADFLQPGEEILLPKDASEVADILQHLAESERVRIGQRARERILSEHTSEHRAIQFERIVADSS
jgi:spore maturation protein CgeB